MIPIPKSSHKLNSVSDVLPHSLNNVTGDAPPKNQTQSPDGLTGFQTLPDNAFSSDPESSKRDLLDSSLKGNFPGLKFSNDFWSFIEVWQSSAEKVFKIRDTDFCSYRKWKFQKCYFMNARGRVYVERQDPDSRYRERFHCGETACLLCENLHRTRLALEWVKDYKQIVMKHQGFPGFLFVTFTLPEEYERVPLYDPNTEQRLLDSIQAILREMFGLKSRSNLSMNIVVHPIGSADLKRNRWHVHAGIFPAVIEKHRKTREKQFRWVYPVHVTKYHTDRKWLIDLGWLRYIWNTTLGRFFGEERCEAIYPEVKFIAHPRDQVEYGVDRFWAHVTHRFVYDLRSFASDLEKSFLRVDKDTKRIVLKVEKGKISTWDVVDSIALVERYKFIREHNRVRARGWAQSKKMHAWLLGISEEELSDKPDCVSVDAKVKVIRKKRFDPKLARVITRKEEMYFFRDPVSQKDMEIPAKNIPPLEMGAWMIPAFRNVRG